MDSVFKNAVETYYWYNTRWINHEVWDSLTKDLETKYINWVPKKEESLQLNEDEKNKQMIKGEVKKMVSNNQKKDKFIELAKSRVNRAINMIRLISNLANKSHYDYTPEQTKKIIKALNDEVRSVEAKFASKKRGTEEFSL
jgi:hypothetical protein